MPSFIVFNICFILICGCYASQEELEPYSADLQNKAEAGDAQAQFLLGYNKLYGRGTPKNEQEAIQWYVLSAKQGHKRAMNTLGGFFLKNKIDSPETDAEMAKATPEISFSKAKKDKTQPHHLQMAVFWFMRAADAGNPRAMGNIGMLYWNGLGLEQSDSEAVRWWKEGSSEGDIGSQCRLSLAFSEGRGVEKNPQKAFELMCLAANKKPADESEKEWVARAQNELSRYYYYGLGVEKDLKESFKWNKKSAEGGNAVGQFNLGTAYKNGDGVDKNLVEAIRWYEKSAEQGYEGALFELGYLNDRGIGMEQNYKKAFEYYTKAAQKGEAKAQNNLGSLYSQGRGTRQNDTEAFRYFLRSSLQTNVVAYGNLASCYENGRGVERNLSEAVKWYYKGAQAGQAYSQYMLARIYESGNGVQKSLNLAQDWYEKAAKQGYEPAKEALSRIQTKITE